MTETLSLDRLAGRVADGAMLALPPDYSFVPMAAVRALVRRSVCNLHLRHGAAGRHRGGPPDRRGVALPPSRLRR